MLFVIQWSGSATSRKMAEDRLQRGDGLAPPNIKLLGRWRMTSEPGGYAVVEAEDASDIAVWLIQWHDLFKFTLTPVEAAEIREIDVKLSDA